MELLDLGVLTDVPRSGVREEALAGTLQTLYSTVKLALRTMTVAGAMLQTRFMKLLNGQQ
jgi:hypothetical protein